MSMSDFLAMGGSTTSSSYQSAAFQMINDLVSELTARHSYTNGMGDSFAGSDGIYASLSSNYAIESGYLRNTITTGSAGGGNWGENLIPTMTAATTAGWTASASSVYGGSQAAYLACTTGSSWSANYWISAGAPTAWIQLQAPSATQIMGYSFGSCYNGHAPTAWKLQGSNDETEWTDLDNRSGIDWSGTAGVTAFKTFKLSAQATYNYYRLYVTASTDNNYVGVTSFKLLSPLTNAIPAMTGNSSPYCVISASSSYGSYPPYMLFDRTKTAWWQTANGVTAATVQCQFPRVTKLDAYSILMSATSGVTGIAPTAWTFEGSSDGTDWTVLDTRTAQTFTADVKKIYTLSSTASYQYYRINITASLSATFVGMTEMELLSPEGTPIPIMTSTNDIDNTVTLSSSGCNSSYPVTNGFDGNTSTYLQFATCNQSNYVQALFTTARTIRSIVLNGYGSVLPPSLQVLGSNDGSSWDILFSGSLSLSAGVDYNIVLTSPGSYTYCQLVFPASESYYWSFYNIAFVSDPLPSTDVTVNELTAVTNAMTLSGAAAGTIFFTGTYQDATAQLDVGNSGYNHMEVAISVDSGVTWRTALAIASVESLGNNRYRYTTAEFDLTSATSLMIRFKTFARETVAPNVRLEYYVAIDRVAA